MVQNVVNVQEHPLRDHDLRKKYDEKRPLFELLAKTVEVILYNKFYETDMRPHSISTRVKEFKSLAEKILRKSYSDPFSENTDFVGVRVICKFLSDIEVVKNCLSKIFIIDDAEEYIEKSTFGYMSNHYIARLKGDFVDSIDIKMKDIRFEIQVRTIGMDAWANASHYLHYKKESDMPEDFVKEFNAISATYYLLDKQLNQFYLRQAENIKRLKKSDLMAEPVNIDSIYEYAEKNLSQYEDTEKENLSEVVDDFLQIGAKSIGDVDKIVQKGKKRVEKFLQKNSEYMADYEGALRMSFLYTVDEDDLSDRNKKIKAIFDKFQS